MGYRAFVVNRTGEQFSAGLTTLAESDLPPGDVTIRVEWSSVNYKDGLAATPEGRVVRAFPMVPGVDLAGTVESVGGYGASSQGDIVYRVVVAPSGQVPAGLRWNMTVTIEIDGTAPAG